jgi:glycosyltransferase involved in cell wall biosynthesis
VGAAGGGVAETVVDGETGLLFAPDSVGGLVEALRRLLAAPELRSRLGEAGRRRARERYSVEGCAKRVAVVYQSALGAPVESGWTSLSLLGGLA